MPLPAPSPGSTPEAWVRALGEVFAVFDTQDSGCVSYGVRVGGERLFVKTPTTPAAVSSLRSAVRFHAAVRHPAINPVLQVVAFGDEPSLVLPWLDAELLNHSTTVGRTDRAHPSSAWSRFRAQPVPVVLAAVDTLISAHRAVVDAGFVAVDLYDGSLMYDFDRQALTLIDLDDYRPGPFTALDRLPGSPRFMAPEEWGGGTTIDERTTVFVLGRAARLMLDARDDESAWRGTPEQLSVVRTATAAEPDDRYPTVAALHEAWALSPSGRR